MTSESQPRRATQILRRVGHAVLVVVLGLVGGYVGLRLGGTVHHEVGPLTTSMRLEPTGVGGTTLDIPPLGHMVLDTHRGPLGLHAELEGVDVDEARSLMRDPALLQDLGTQAEEDLRWELQMALLRGLGSGLLGAMLLSALATRRVRSALMGGATAMVAAAASAAIAAATWNPTALAEPRYTGLLANAPAVVGDARQIVDEFSVYGDQIARIVQNVSGLYTVTSELPILPGQDDVVRVLHVSDLHLAPHAWDVIRTVARQYDVDVVVDSGDITDHGSPAENRYVQEIRHIDAPYVWVRGNHDSGSTETAMRKLDNVVVLDGKVRTVAGLRFLGVGDPTFTPDKSIKDQGVDDVARVAESLAAQAEADGDVDVLVYHDPSTASVFDGKAEMALMGHLHYRRVNQSKAGTWLMVQGSTGGSGLRALEPEEPAPILLSVLYVDRESRSLLAYDDIRLGGLGLASAEIKRHVVDLPPPLTEVAPQVGEPTNPPTGDDGASDAD